MPTCFMLIGVPGSGKTTWISKQPFDWSKTVIASTDAYIEHLAHQQAKTYSEVFKDNMPDAVSYMVDVVVDAVNSKQDIVWDQTSISTYTRAKKFKMLPGYTVIGVVFRTPKQYELTKRLNSRLGKIIPIEVVNQMIASWEEPTLTEGFDRIIYEQ